MNSKLFVLIIGFSFINLISPAQDISMPGRKFLTFNQSRLTFGIGALAETTIGYNVSTIYQESKDNYIYSVNWGVNIGLNLYSPNSVVDFTTNLIYATSSMIESNAIKIDNDDYDFIHFHRFETPVFIRFKTGRVTSKQSWVWLIGGSYSMYTKSYSSYNRMDHSYKNHFSLKTGLSAEFQFFADRISRGNMELMYTHPLGNSFSDAYTNSFQTSYYKIKKINFGVLSLGINYFLGGK